MRVLVIAIGCRLLLLRTSIVRVGIGLALLLVAGALASCSSKPATPTPSIRTDTFFNLPLSTLTDVSFTAYLRDGTSEPMAYEAYSGLITVGVPPTVTPARFNELIASLGASIVGQAPELGLYWVLVAPGDEARFIDAIHDSVEFAYPQFPEKPMQEYVIGDWVATGSGRVNGDVSRFQFDDLEPMCVRHCGDDPAPDVYLTLPSTAGGDFGETTDSGEGASHGNVVEYLRRGQGKEGEDAVQGLHGGLSAVALAEVLRARTGATSVTTFTLSMGPGPNDDRRVTAFLEEAHNETLLRELRGAGATGENTIIVKAAGNGDTRKVGVYLTASLSGITGDANRKNLVLVASLDRDGNIASYSNFSTRGGGSPDMIYVPLAFKDPGCAQGSCLLLGTSFAAPEVEYLASALLQQRPDLTAAQVHDVLFDPDVSPRRVINQHGTVFSLPVIADPYGASTLRAALDVAMRRFPPSPATPTPTSQEGKPTPGATSTRVPTPTPTPTLVTTISPAGDITGDWSGGINVIDAPGQNCQWSGPLSLHFQATGNAFAGNGNYTLGNVGTLNQSADCGDPWPRVNANFTGSTSASSIHFTLNSPQSGTFNGSFTSDLMSGTLTFVGADGVTYQGCWQVSRSGSLPNCNNPFLKPTPTPTRTPTPMPTATGTSGLFSLASPTCTVTKTESDSTWHYTYWDVTVPGTVSGPEGSQFTVNSRLDSGNGPGIMSMNNSTAGSWTVTETTTSTFSGRHDAGQPSSTSLTGHVQLVGQDYAEAQFANHADSVVVVQLLFRVPNSSYQTKSATVTCSYQ